MDKGIKIIVSGMESLSATQLYDILKLRQDVFMLEEDIRYPDLDDMDKITTHVFAVDKKEVGEVIAAYTRVYWDEAEKHAKIGRLVTAPEYRGRGLASEVMKEAVAEARKRFNVSEIWLDAQEHVVSFYEGLGFTVMSAPLYRSWNHAYQDVAKILRPGKPVDNTQRRLRKSLPTDYILFS